MSSQQRGGPQHEDFLRIYMDYTRKQESPDLFHLWTAITVLASALGRKCYLERGYYRLYPNLFTILVAGSATCRKSTAINIGVRLLDSCPNTKVVSGKITPEKFISEIAESTKEIEQDGIKHYKTPATLVHSSELSVFLTKQSYGEPLIHILTDLFDCPDAWPYKTKNRGEAFLRNVFICILAATTPDGIAQGIPQSAMQEGFASRILFVYQRSTTRRNAFPVLSPEEIDMHLALKRILQERALMSGEFTLTREAISWYGEWYNNFMESFAPDKRLEGMYGRKHDHVLRVGMVLAASGGSMLIEQSHLEASLLALDSLEKHASGAFTQMGGDELTPHIERAKAYMRRFKRLSHSELLRKLYPVNAQTFKTIVDTLIMGGEMVRDEDKKNILCWIGE